MELNLQSAFVETFEEAAERGDDTICPRQRHAFRITVAEDRGSPRTPATITNTTTTATPAKGTTPPSETNNKPAEAGGGGGVGDARPAFLRTLSGNSATPGMDDGRSTRQQTWTLAATSEKVRGGDRCGGGEGGYWKRKARNPEMDWKSSRSRDLNVAYAVVIACFREGRVGGFGVEDGSRGGRRQVCGWGHGLWGWGWERGRYGGWT